MMASGSLFGYMPLQEPGMVAWREGRGIIPRPSWRFKPYDSNASDGHLKVVHGK